MRLVKQEEHPLIYPYEKEFETVTVPCEDVNEFLHAINIHTDRYSEGKWIFRGQSNAAWMLIPSIFRDNEIICAAKQMLEEHIERHRNDRNDSAIQEVSKRGEAYKLVLARVCAAVEQARVNTFIIGLDNAGITIPYNSEFHRYDPSSTLHDYYKQQNIKVRVPPQSNFDTDYLKFEIYNIVRSYSQMHVPEEEMRNSWFEGAYRVIDQRYLDISFALAQHSGLPTGLLDWTTNPVSRGFLCRL